MTLKTRIYRTVYRPNIGLGGFRSTPAEIAGASPMDVPVPPQPLEHPVTLTTSADLPLPQPLKPTPTSSLALEDLP